MCYVDLHAALTLHMGLTSDKLYSPMHQRDMMSISYPFSQTIIITIPLSVLRNHSLFIHFPQVYYHKWINKRNRWFPISNYSRCGLA